MVSRQQEDLWDLTRVQLHLIRMLPEMRMQMAVREVQGEMRVMVEQVVLVLWVLQVLEVEWEVQEALHMLEV